MRKWMFALHLLVSLVLLHLGTAAADEGSVREPWRGRTAAQADQADAPALITAPGDYSFSLEHGGLTRLYLVHVPRSYQSGQPMPLLLVFHGGGGNMRFQADDKNYGLISKSESAGFIAVFPNGYSAFPKGILATWNAGNCCGSARDKNIDDVGFVRQLLAQLQRQLKLDPQRIYATGMSNGGMMAHRLACEMADVFKGIAAVAGTDNTTSCAPARPISVLVIHAKDDMHVLFNGGAGEGAFRDSSKVTDFTSVPQTVLSWRTRKRCDAVPTRVLERPGAYCELYSGCADKAPLQLCVTDSGGHSWPGAEKVRRGKAAASQAISANDVMWEFFSKL